MLTIAILLQELCQAHVASSHIYNECHLVWIIGTDQPSLVEETSALVEELSKSGWFLHIRRICDVTVL